MLHLISPSEEEREREMERSGAATAAVALMQSTDSLSSHAVLRDDVRTCASLGCLSLVSREHLLPLKQQASD